MNLCRKIYPNRTMGKCSNLGENFEMELALQPKRLRNFFLRGIENLVTRDLK